MREKLKYALYRGLFTSLALLPFPVLYGISDGLKFLFSRVIKYRRKVIRANLRNSFPEKTEAELLDIERDFYSQFADNIVETIKLLHISNKEVDKRVTVKNGELVEKLVAEGHPVVVYLGHYANWEYVPALVRSVKLDGIFAQVYKPARDKAFDKLMLKLRSRFHSVSVKQERVFRTMIGWYRDKTPFVIGFIADHRSNYSQSHHSTTFLNQHTPFNPGGEEIGSRVNAAYVYLDVEKNSRGHYQLTFKPIEPTDMSVDSPYTRRYLEMLEETIRRRPGLWLWSHRRWLY